jgi:hypothetical protein
MGWLERGYRIAGTRWSHEGEGFDDGGDLAVPRNWM